MLVLREKCGRRSRREREGEKGGVGEVGGGSLCSCALGWYGGEEGKRAVGCCSCAGGPSKRVSGC